MSTKKCITLGVAMLVALTSTALADKPAGNDTWKGNSLLVPPQAHYGGKSHAQWIQEFWLWPL